MTVETREAVVGRIRNYLSQNLLFSDQVDYEDDTSFLETGSSIRSA